jgi:hypothetical protein
MKSRSATLSALALVCPPFTQQVIAATATNAGASEIRRVEKWRARRAARYGFQELGRRAAVPDFDKHRRQNGLYYGLPVRAFELGAMEQGASGIADTRRPTTTAWNIRFRWRPKATASRLADSKQSTLAPAILLFKGNDDSSIAYALK